jgi:heme O synthase-like polyprenyltransferase
MEDDLNLEARDMLFFFWNHGIFHALALSFELDYQWYAGCCCLASISSDLQTETDSLQYLLSIVL